MKVYACGFRNVHVTNRNEPHGLSFSSLRHPIRSSSAPSASDAAWESGSSRPTPPSAQGTIGRPDIFGQPEKSSLWVWITTRDRSLFKSRSTSFPFGNWNDNRPPPMTTRSGKRRSILTARTENIAVKGSPISNPPTVPHPGPL